MNFTLNFLHYFVQYQVTRQLQTAQPVFIIIENTVRWFGFQNLDEFCAIPIECIDVHVAHYRNVRIYLHFTR